LHHVVKILINKEEKQSISHLGELEKKLIMKNVMINI